MIINDSLPFIKSYVDVINQALIDTHGFTRGYLLNTCVACHLIQ